MFCVCQDTNALALPPEMTSSVKLINDQFQMLDSCLEFLTDQTDFIVIGCVGPQGAGKSTLMSHLAGSSPGQLAKWVLDLELMNYLGRWEVSVGSNPTLI